RRSLRRIRSPSSRDDGPSLPTRAALQVGGRARRRGRRVETRCPRGARLRRSTHSSRALPPPGPTAAPLGCGSAPEKIGAQRSVVDLQTLKKNSPAKAQRRKVNSESLTSSLRLCDFAGNLNHSCNNLPDAALELTVVGDGRAHRDVGGIDWRNAECDELGGVDQ